MYSTMVGNVHQESFIPVEYTPETLVTIESRLESWLHLNTVVRYKNDVKVYTTR